MKRERKICPKNAGDFSAVHTRLAKEREKFRPAGPAVCSFDNTPKSFLHG
jgi:hypothetical protein